MAASDWSTFNRARCKGGWSTTWLVPIGQHSAGRGARARAMPGLGPRAAGQLRGWFRLVDCVAVSDWSVSILTS